MTILKGTFEIDYDPEEGAIGIGILVKGTYFDIGADDDMLEDLNREHGDELQNMYDRIMEDRRTESLITNREMDK